MKRTIVVGLVLFAAGSVPAQQHYSISVGGDGEGATVKKVQSGSISFGGGSPRSAAQLLLPYDGLGRHIIYGRIPLVYQMMDLTGEQTKAIQDLCSAAKNERSALTKNRRKQVQGKTREDYRAAYMERKAKEDAIIAKYEERIAELLTPEQRALWKKIKKIADDRAAADKKDADAFRIAREKTRELYEGKLNAILTPEQIEKIEKAAKPPSRASRHGGPAQR